jgi:Ca2+-binding EF-hand superfamily protein
MLGVGLLLLGLQVVTSTGSASTSKSATLTTLFDSIDADADGRITSNEIVKYLTLAHDIFESVKHEKVREKNKELIETSIAKMDANDDGLITPEEAATLDASDYLFSLADGDRSHTLTKDEAVVFIIPELATDEKRKAFYLTETNFDRLDLNSDETLDYEEYAVEFRKREMDDTSHYDGTFMDMKDADHRTLVEQDIHDTFYYRADKDQDAKLHKEELVHAYLFFMEKPDFAGEAEAVMEGLDQDTKGHAVFSELESTPQHVIDFLLTHMDGEHHKPDHFKDHSGERDAAEL